jgi:hypothetical protein
MNIRPTDRIAPIDETLQPAGRADIKNMVRAVAVVVSFHNRTTVLT